MNTHAKEYRKTAWASGQARKAQRTKAQEVRAAANAAAGNTPKRQTRKRRSDNMRTCLRCHTRRIVAGSVCWCESIGAQSR
jgi:cytochrome c553